MYTIILAGHSAEANTYVKAAKLGMGRFRYATQASTIRGLRVARVVELPGFAGRADRHALNAALRYTKGERVVVTADEFADLKAGLAQARTAYSLERAATLAHRYEAIKEASGGVKARAPKQGEDAAPAEEDDLFANPPSRKRATAKRKTAAAPKLAATPNLSAGEFF